MHVGHYISGAAHLSFLLWLVMGDVFTSKPEEISITSVSIISEEQFANQLAKDSNPQVSDEIDILKFDQEFLSLLGIVASILTIFGIFVLRPLMENSSMSRLIIILSIAGSIFLLPSLGMFYGIHEFTSKLTNGIVDARFIAIFNTALESPLGQVSMIPILAWIAQSAPSHLKATFFAVLASFTNLALSASNLGTKYLNQIFVVTREVKSKTGEITTQADYSELGILLLTVLLLTLTLPILATILIRKLKLIAY